MSDSTSGHNLSEVENSRESNNTQSDDSLIRSNHDELEESSRGSSIDDSEMDDVLSTSVDESGEFSSLDDSDEEIMLSGSDSSVVPPIPLFRIRSRRSRLRRRGYLIPMDDDSDIITVETSNEASDIEVIPNIEVNEITLGAEAQNNNESGLEGNAEIISDAEPQLEAVTEIGDVDNNVTESEGSHVNQSELGNNVEVPENSNSPGGNALPGELSVISESCSKSPVISKIRKVKKTASELDPGDDGQTCSICFEHWDNSGDHRIASLKCGHLFGKQCIERWLKGNGSRCPQCNANATRKDIRVLYVKSVRVLDTTEKDRLAQELAAVKSEKLSLERKHSKVMINNELNTMLIAKLQTELRMLKESLKNKSIQTIDISGTTPNVYNFVLYKSFDLINGCRVMCYNEWLNMLIVSVSTSVGMFSGCGIRKINLFDMRMDKYIAIHNKEIRDLSLNPMNHEIILSASRDKTVKITNVCNGANVHHYKVDSAIFSCCWKANSSTEFYVGTNSGTVFHFNTASEDPIDVITVTGWGPVVALLYIDSIEGVGGEGILIVRLDTIFVKELNHGKKEHKLDIDGPFTGADYDPLSKHFLINCRPSQRQPHTRHILCNLMAMEINNNRFIELREVYTFLGSSTMKILAKSSIVVSILDKTWVVVNEESTLSAKIYDASSSQLIQKIHFSATVVGCLLARVQTDCYIVFLTEKKAYLYKLIEQ